MRRFNYDLKKRQIGLSSFKSLNYSCLNKTTVFLSSEKYQTHPNFLLKNIKTNDVIFDGQILNPAEIRLDQRDCYFAPMFQTEAQQNSYLSNAKFIKQKYQKEIDQYVHLNVMMKPMDIQETDCPEKKCQICQAAFNDYKTHIKSQEHRNLRKKEVDHELVDLLKGKSSPIEISSKQQNKKINLNNRKHQDQYQKKQKKKTQQFISNLKAFKFIKDAIINMNQKL